MPPEWTVSLGEANEWLAGRLGISRERQDEFADRSHALANRVPVAPLPPSRPGSGTSSSGCAGASATARSPRDLYIGEATVKTYVSRLLDKFAAIESGALPVSHR
jgi:hypothetical protein